MLVLLQEKTVCGNSSANFLFMNTVCFLPLPAADDFPICSPTCCLFWRRECGGGETLQRNALKIVLLNLVRTKETSA